MKSVRSTRPISRRVTASSCWRGGATFRSSWLGERAPLARVAATCRMSGQFRTITSSRILLPANPIQGFRNGSGFEDMQPFRRQVRMRQWSNWGCSRPRLPIPVGVFVRAFLVALPFPFSLRQGLGSLEEFQVRDAGSELSAGFGDFARFRASAHGVGSLGFGWACLGLIGSLSNPDCYDIFESAPSLIFYLSGSQVMDHKVMRLFIGKNHDEKVASALYKAYFA